MKRLVLTAIIINLLCSSFPARAGIFYLETGFGASQIRQSSNLFPSLDSAPKVGFGGNVMLGFNILGDDEPLQVHLGIADHFHTSFGEDGTAYGIHGIYPVFRLETPRFYVGGGATPLILTNEGTPYTLNYNFPPGSIAVLLEAGLLWRMVPYFHFAIGANTQWIQNSGALGPKPAGAVTAQLRFIIGTTSSSSRTDKRDYDGWRYPFGIEIWD